MTTQIRVGALIGRGAGNIPAKHMMTLLENKSEVERIVSEIDERIDRHVVAQRAANEALGSRS